jgi:hypothetical protein
MITFVYDAFLGRPVRDGDAEDIARRLVSEHNNGHNPYVVFATGNVLLALRVEMRHGNIAASEIALVFNKYDDQRQFVEGIPLRLYPSGGISPRPDGFNDIEDRLLTELL